MKGACINAAGICSWVPRPGRPPQIQPATDWQNLRGRHRPGGAVIQSGVHALHHILYIKATVEQQGLVLSYQKLKE